MTNRCIEVFGTRAAGIKSLTFMLTISYTSGCNGKKWRRQIYATAITESLTNDSLYYRDTQGNNDTEHVQRRHSGSWFRKLKCN